MAEQLNEIRINKFSQLVYLDATPAMGEGTLPTVGQLADYYLGSSKGKAHMKARFGNIPLEYAGWLQFLAEGVADVAHYRIGNVLDDNGPDASGFYGCSYLPPGDGPVVAAFRGSEMLGNQSYKNDYRMDFSLTWDDKPAQQRVVERYLDTFADFRRRPFYLTGHSLGGNLAAYGAVVTAVAENRNLLGCHAFNAPGFGGGFSRQHRDAIAAVGERLHLHQNRHDIVSSLLVGLKEPIIHTSVYDPGQLEAPSLGDLFYPHSNFMFQKGAEAFPVDPSGEKDEVCRLAGRVSRLFLLLPAFVKRGISDLVLEVVYSSQPPKRQVEFLLEKATRYFVLHDVAGLPEEGLAAASTLYAAKQLWLQPRPATELYRTVAQEELGEDARMAGAVLLLVKVLQYLRQGEACEDCERDGGAEP